MINFVYILSQTQKIKKSRYTELKAEPKITTVIKMSKESVFLGIYFFDYVTSILPAA